MTFSLLENPFAVLGLTTAASAREIGEQVAELGSVEAASAGHDLIAPVRRLHAELRFLPGAGANLTAMVLAALRAGGVPEVDKLSLPAKANVLAHLAASPAAKPSVLRELTEIHSRLTREVVLEAVAADRTTAGMPAPNEDLGGNSVDVWTEEHAKALASGTWSLAEQAGAGLLVDLIKATKPAQHRRRSFLRAATASWGREAAAITTRLEEEAKRAEASLSTKPTTEAADNLAAAIRAWARLTEPERAIDAIDNLSHKASVDAAGRWRNLAVELANECGAIHEALTVITVLVAEFGSLSALGARIRADATALQRRLTSQRLAAAIEASRLGAAIVLIDKLLSSEADATERQSLSTARRAIVRRLWTRRFKFGVGIAFMALIVWAVAQNNSGNTGAAPPPEQSAVAVGNETATVRSGVQASPPPAPTVIAPSEPAVGSTTLTQAELLWCLEQGQRIDAAKALLDSPETSSRYTADEITAGVAQFNAVVGQTSSSCYQKEHDDSDRQAVQRQLDGDAALLRSQGQQIILKAIGNAIAGGQRATVAPAQPAPAPPAITGVQAIAPAGDLDDPRFATWVQQQLAARGFDPGPADGNFGPMSRAALEAFKRSRGISPADDTIDQATMQALSN